MTAVETGEALGRFLAEVSVILLGIYLGKKYFWDKMEKKK